jgi:hypothetical protein
MMFRALLIMVLLFTSAGKVSAECAWLMWAYALDQQAGEHYSVEAARPTNPDCLAASRRWQ